MNTIEIYKQAIFEKVTQSTDIDFLTWLYAEILAYNLNEERKNQK